MYVRLIVLFLLVLLSYQTFSQLKKTESLEIPLQENEIPFYVIPAEEFGVVLYRQRQNGIADDYNHYEFLFHDKDLKPVWTSLVQTEFMFEVVQHAYANGQVFIVFSGVINFKRRLFIYRFDLKAQTYEAIPIDTFFPDLISYFSIFKNTMIIGGRERSKPSIVFYNLEDRRPVILQGFYGKNINIYEVSIDEENGLFTVLVGYIGKNRQASLNIKSYDEFGQPVEDMRIEPDRGKDIVHAKGIIANNNMRLITGLYQEKNSVYPTGVFLSSVFLDGNKKIVYYSFQSLLHVMDSINRGFSENQEEYITNPIVNPEKYQWHITNMSEYENENVAVAESYTTEKNSTTFMDKSVIYRLKDALILGFTDQLELNWINHFNMYPMISERLEEYVRLKSYPDSIRLSLFYKNQLSEKVIHTYKVNNPVLNVQMKNFESDQLNSNDYYEEFSQFIPWFQDFYLFIGLKQNEDKQDQKVFLVRKFYYP